MEIDLEIIDKQIIKIHHNQDPIQQTLTYNISKKT